MNLRKEILKEHSKAQRDRIVAYIGNDEKRFSTLVNVFLEGPYRITQRASWPLSIIAQRHAKLLAPHLPKIIDNLKKTGLHDAVKRNTIRLLQFVEIPKSLEGKVADTCFLFLQNPKEAIAVRVFSMVVLARIVKSQPGLRKELGIIIEDQLPYAGPAFRSCSRKILRELTLTVDKNVET